MILLTGASGVIGQDLAPRLNPDQLILARHRARPDGAARQVAMDIRDPALGLSAADYAALADEVDTIIHCAAITDMSGQVPELSATNISGVRHVVDFANAAGARLHFVSTAYCSETYGPAAPVASEYVGSKRVAESVVHESGLDWTIIRPSIIAGHSQTGAIASFQGFHLFIATVLKGRLPIIPVARQTPCDFVAVDWVAEAIARIASAPVWGRTYWLTAGGASLTIEEMMETGRSFASARGRDLDQVELMTPQAVEADILPGLRPRLQERLMILVNLAKVMARRTAFPSDLDAVDKAGLKQALLSNLDYWGAQNG
ncbi:MAG: SDR family oxidoreductase [Pseudomonadota bacterium]